MARDLRLTGPLVLSAAVFVLAVAGLVPMPTYSLWWVHMLSLEASLCGFPAGSRGLAPGSPGIARPAIEAIDAGQDLGDRCDGNQPGAGAGDRPRLGGLQQVLGFPRRLANRLHSVEQLIELAAELLWRPHGDDLIGEQPKGILDQLELPARGGQVGVNFDVFFLALGQDHDIFLRQGALFPRLVLEEILVSPQIALDLVHRDRSKVILVSGTSD
jgi:hypothetical protein